MFDAIGSEFSPDCAADADSREKVRSWGQVQRSNLRHYPGIAAWPMDNGPAGKHTYRILDILTAALSTGGFNDAQVARSATLIMSWTFSRIAIEDNADRRKASTNPDRARSFASGMSEVEPAVYPAATRVGEELFRLQMEEIFDLGLESIIHGITRLGESFTSGAPAAWHWGHRPKISRICRLTVNPCACAMARNQPSSGASISTAVPQISHTRW